MTALAAGAFEKVLGLIKGGAAAARSVNAAGVAKGAVSAVTGVSRSAIKANPLMGLSGAALGLSYADHSLVRPVAKAVYGQATSSRRFDEQLKAERELMFQRRAFELQQRRLQRDMGENLARLAAVAPDVYNRVLAGRMLPKGATVIGGQPRTDLLEELASRMASGSYQQPSEDELLQGLTGA